MKWSRFVFSLLMLLGCNTAMADDTIQVNPQEDEGYNLRIKRMRNRWNSLIPSQIIIQNAGNMGVLSAGIGWNYGKGKKWETHLLLGFIPKHQTSRAKLTMTIKENFIPWNIDLKKGWSLNPLTASLYVNTVYGSEFWKSQPGRYPDGYYEFMSTRFRLNIALGQRITFLIPQNKRRHHKSISLFYEISSCDLYIRSKIQDRSVSLNDILGLSLGIKFQAF